MHDLECRCVMQQLSLGSKPTCVQATREEQGPHSEQHSFHCAPQSHA